MSMIYVSECGHIVDVHELDRLNYGAVPSSGSHIHPFLMNRELGVQDFGEPRCQCGDLALSTRRYSIVTKLARYPKTFDLLVASIGRKLSQISGTIDIIGKGLDSGFEDFIGKIRPNPLAASANIQHVLRRHRETLVIRKTILAFQSDVVEPFCRSIAELHAAFPKIVPLARLLFGEHFTLLEHRAKSLHIRDSMKVAECLTALKDPSQCVQRQGLKMSEFVHREAKSCIDDCQEALVRMSQKDTPALHAELTLQLAQYHLVAKHSELHICRNSGEEIQVSLDMKDTTLKASLEAISKTPNTTCAASQDHAATANDFLEWLKSYDNGDLIQVPTITNPVGQHLESLWGHLKPGCIQLCRHMHVFSRQVFTEGCPSCANVAPSLPSYADARKHLHEGDFLKAMRGVDDGVHASPVTTTSSKDDQTSDANAESGQPACDDGGA